VVFKLPPIYAVEQRQWSANKQENRGELIVYPNYEIGGGGVVESKSLLVPSAFVVCLVTFRAERRQNLVIAIFVALLDPRHPFNASQTRRLVVAICLGSGAP
jgi:hypothetical protein